MSGKLSHHLLRLPRRKHISIVVPFFNEGDGVEIFNAALQTVLAELPDYQFEIICIDDGSTDDTLDRLLTLAQTNPQYHVIELSRNFGKEAAMTAGLDLASGQAVIPIDADLQDPPCLILQFVRAWENGAEVVLAHRAHRDTDSYLKRKTAAWFYRLHNHLADISIPQNVGDFRLMDRCVVDALKRLPEQQRFMKGLFSWVGFKTVVVEYDREPRAFGASKFPGWKLWNFAIEGITSFSTTPLKIWTYVGTTGAAFTILYALFILLRVLI